MLDNLLEEAQTGKPDSLLVEAAGVTDRRLFANEKFIVVPSVSPIIVNHVMVIPKFPVSGFWQVRARDLEVVLESVAKIKPVSRGFLQFEHGIFSPEEYRCGINQAHLHLVPERSGFVEYLRSNLRTLAARTDAEFFEDLEFSDLGKFRGCATSYIAIRSGSGSKFGIYGYKIASQLIRQSASKFGYPCGANWRSLENWEQFQTTLRDWRERIG